MRAGKAKKRVQGREHRKASICEVGAAVGCRPHGRLNVRIGDDDDLGGFIFGTSGFNSIRTLATRRKYLDAVSGGRLACLALGLRLRGKSTTQSHCTPVYYVDLVTRPGSPLPQVLAQARSMSEERKRAVIPS